MGINLTLLIKTKKGLFMDKEQNKDKKLEFYPTITNTPKIMYINIKNP